MNVNKEERCFPEALVGGGGGNVDKRHKVSIISSENGRGVYSNTGAV